MNTMVINYFIIAAIFLIILLTLEGSSSINLKLLTAFFLMTIIIFQLTRKNIYHAVALSAIITFLFYAMNGWCKRGIEGFEGSEEEIMKELDELTKSQNEVTAEDLDGEEAAEGIPDLKNTYIQSARAQRETFRLINTLKQLDDTVKSLAPTLKEGSNVIDRLKKLNLVDSA